MARTPSFRGKRSRGPTRIRAQFGDRTLYLTPREARFVRERASLHQTMMGIFPHPGAPYPFIQQAHPGGRPTNC